MKLRRAALKEGRLNQELEQVVSKIQSYESKNKQLDTEFLTYQYLKKEAKKHETMANTEGTNELKALLNELVDQNTKKKNQSKRETSRMTNLVLEKSMQFSVERPSDLKRSVSSKFGLLERVSYCSRSNSDASDMQLSLENSILRGKKRQKEVEEALKRVSKEMNVMEEKREELLFKHQTMKHDLQVLQGNLRQLKEDAKSYEKFSIDKAVVLVEANNYYIESIEKMREEQEGFENDRKSQEKELEYKRFALKKTKEFNAEKKLEAVETMLKKDNLASQKLLVQSRLVKASQIFNDKQQDQPDLIKVLKMISVIEKAVLKVRNPGVSPASKAITGRKSPKSDRIRTASFGQIATDESQGKLITLDSSLDIETMGMGSREKFVQKISSFYEKCSGDVQGLENEILGWFKKQEVQLASANQSFFSVQRELAKEKKKLTELETLSAEMRDLIEKNLEFEGKAVAPIEEILKFQEKTDDINDGDVKTMSSIKEKVVKREKDVFNIYMKFCEMVHRISHIVMKIGEILGYMRLANTPNLSVYLEKTAEYRKGFVWKGPLVIKNPNGGRLLTQGSKGSNSPPRIAGFFTRTPKESMATVTENSLEDDDFIHFKAYESFQKNILPFLVTTKKEFRNAIEMGLRNEWGKSSSQIFETEDPEDRETKEIILSAIVQDMTTMFFCSQSKVYEWVNGCGTASEALKSIGKLKTEALNEFRIRFQDLMDLFVGMQSDLNDFSQVIKERLKKIIPVKILKTRRRNNNGMFFKRWEDTMSLQYDQFLTNNEPADVENNEGYIAEINEQKEPKEFLKVIMEKDEKKKELNDLKETIGIKFRSHGKVGNFDALKKIHLRKKLKPMILIFWDDSQQEGLRFFYSGSPFELFGRTEAIQFSFEQNSG